MTEVGRPVRIADGGGSAVALGPGGRFAVATTTAVRSYDAEGVVTELTPPGPVADLSFVAGGTILAAGVHRYELAAETWLAEVALGTGPPSSAGSQVVRAACWDPTASQLVVATEFRRSRSAGSGAGQPGLVLRADEGGSRVLAELDATAVALTGDGHVLAAGQELAVLDPGGAVTARIALHGGVARTLALRGALLVVATRGGHLAVVELGAGGTALLRATWPAHEETVIGAGWLGDDRLASVGWSGDVRVWDRTGRQVATEESAPDEAAPATAFATDGAARLLVVRGGPDAGVLRYDVR